MNKSLIGRICFCVSISIYFFEWLTTGLENWCNGNENKIIKLQNRQQKDHAGKRWTIQSGAKISVIISLKSWPFLVCDDQQCHDPETDLF